jgi:chemotaxis protein methyltransferase CheR
MKDASFEPGDLERVIAELNQLCGVDLGGYCRGTLERQLAVYIEKSGAAGIDGLIEILRSSPAEPLLLLEGLTVTVGAFFRDPLTFELLDGIVLPGIIEGALREGRREIRMWSAGCGRGEEPYSLAILLDRHLQGEGAALRPLLFATDIDESALGAAKKGVYSRESLLQTKLGVIDEHFQRRGDTWVLDRRIRNMVNFSRHDVTSPKTLSPEESIFGSFDLVLCRNLLIYFTEELQRAVLEKLAKAVSPGGYLVIGSWEAVNLVDRKVFTPLSPRQRIFRKRPAPRGGKSGR